MSHSLHRVGNVEELKKDYVVLSMGALGFNKEEAGEKLKTIARILIRHQPVNMGDAAYGSLYTGQIKEDFLSERTPKVLTAVYSDKETVKKVLAEIKAENLKISVVVSGLIDEIDEMVSETGLELHTVNLSAGYFGRTELIAEESILEFTSMCGHHLISPNLVRDVLTKYRSSKLSLDEAAERLGRNCVCGIFNLDRAKELILKNTKQR